MTISNIKKQIRRFIHVRIKKLRRIAGKTLGLQVVQNRSALLLERYESPYLDPSTGSEYKEICDAIAKSGMRIVFDMPANYTVYNSIKYIIENNIPGDIVECGVGNGIKIRIIVEFLVRRGTIDRQIFLYDTFAGMTAPSEHDAKTVVSLDVQKKWELHRAETHNNWYYFALETVRANIEQAGYPKEKFFFIQGDVLKTLPNKKHERVALLRLDTDFYESSRHELVHLYDLVSHRGVVIFDDYGGWEGQRKATDDFFKQRGEFPFFHRTCRKERVVIK